MSSQSTSTAMAAPASPSAQHTPMDRASAYSDGKFDEKLVGEMLGLTPQDLLSQTLTALVKKDNALLHGAFETLRAEGFDANSFLKDI